ncbi:MAG: hypothetical protein WC856_11060 [Methylococcaceae bacterium]|jgi:hypothetical protein
MDGIEQFHFFILLFKEWFYKSRPRAIAERKIVDFRFNFRSWLSEQRLKLFCDKKMKVCLRLGDNAVSLRLPDEMTAAKATAFIRGLDFLFLRLNLIATNCGLCGKMQLHLKQCTALLAAEQTIVH